MVSNSVSSRLQHFNELRIIIGECNVCYFRVGRVSSMLVEVLTDLIFNFLL